VHTVACEQIEITICHPQHDKEFSLPRKIAQFLERPSQKAERQYIPTHPKSGFALQSDEYVGEIFYSVDLYHGWNVQPDLQYIINPGGYDGATNQLVFGVQLNVPF
jgi:carbohydrate-selective porin OprB